MRNWIRTLTIPFFAIVGKSAALLPRHRWQPAGLTRYPASARMSTAWRPNYYENNNMLTLNHLAQHNAVNPMVIVLCGLPGSGKSTYAKQLVGRLPMPYRNRWVVANQDALGTRVNVVRVARAALQTKRSVIIDRCNFNAEQRSHWIELAQEFNIPSVFGVVMPHHIDTEFCIERAVVRGNSDGHGEDVNWRAVCIGMRREYTAPEVSEGFAGVFQCSNEADLLCFANSVADVGLRQLEEVDAELNSRSTIVGGKRDPLGLQL